MKKIETEKRRTAILLHLMKITTTDNECADVMLVTACRELGIVSTRDEIVDAIDWLGEHHLVTVERAGDVVLAKITRDGKAVARGHKIVDGITPPVEFD